MEFINIEADWCVNDIINDWLHEINLPLDTAGGVAYATEQEMVGGLYMDWRDNYNDDVDFEIATSFIDKWGYNIEYITTINDLYNWWCWKGGVESYYKNNIIEKLDLIYYFEAEEKCKQAVIEEELDLQYWD